jgi:SAM-dependent methyltransferase
LRRVDGYTTDVDFPAYFYKEMSPVWLSCVSLWQGFEPPDLTRPFSYCELGCGLGVNLLVAAACHPDGWFVGVDFNERHLRVARAAAHAAGLKNIEFVHSGFQEFAQSGSSVFDFMATHGVWSWIAPEHRESLLDCVRQRLKPGGLFYVHYMCHPGSTDLAAVQQVLNLFAPHVPGTSAQQVQMGMKLLRQLADRGMFVDQPGVLKHLDILQRKDPGHLAHEFLTDHWQPQHCVDVHQQMGALGLGYLGSADVFNNLDVALSVPGKVQGIVRQTGIPALAETLKDMARNSHQRMDLFQRFPRPLSQERFNALLGNTVFRSLDDLVDGESWVFPTPIGPVEAPQELCAAVMRRLAAGPARFSELVQHTGTAGSTERLFQTLQLMWMHGSVHPILPAAASGSEHASELTRWFRGNGIALRALAECGTAVSVDTAKR